MKDGVARLQSLRRGRTTLAWLLSVMACLPGCGLFRPEIRYVSQVVTADCPRPDPPVLTEPRPPGYYLNRLETILLGSPPTPMPTPASTPSVTGTPPR